MKSANMPQQTVDIILKVFKSLQQKVLWKWEDDNVNYWQFYKNMDKLYLASFLDPESTTKCDGEKVDATIRHPST